MAEISLILTAFEEVYSREYLPDVNGEEEVDSRRHLPNVNGE